MTNDFQSLRRQLGRPPRGTWRVQTRCGFGYPVVIVTAPVLEDGSPFPTLHYLTCPHLREEIAALESAGGIVRWERLLATEPALRARLDAADDAYRRARAAEAGGIDPTPEVGIAGQRDPHATKCLHAHAAAFLAGLDDPIGEETMARVVRECADARCGEAGR